MIFIPAACTIHCPLVPSPLPSDSPAVAGCFASTRGCTHKLWTGCLLCSRITEAEKVNFDNGNISEKKGSSRAKSRKRLPLQSWCCPYCSPGWSWKGWRSSCLSCLFAASQLKLNSFTHMQLFLYWAVRGHFDLKKPFSVPRSHHSWD